MLARLLEHWDRQRFTGTVISLGSAGHVGERIAGSGIRTIGLGLSRAFPNPVGLARLVRLLRQEQPDVVQTWMYHADVVGGIAARLAGVPAVAWNIRHSDLDPHAIRRRTIWIARAAARLSTRIPDIIVCCSRRAMTTHAGLGYDAARMRYIPNGFDTRAFQPDPGAREEVRKELNIHPSAPIVGLVGRFAPMKDHATFFAAAGSLQRELPDTHFVLCGGEITADNARLVELARGSGVIDQCRFLGVREDMSRVTNAFDVAVSASSSGEGFSNVLGEAMASGVPCVTTDVGDSASIVANTGIVVPPGDPTALATGMADILSAEPPRRHSLGQAARARIIDQFGLEATTGRYEALYAALGTRASDHSADAEPS